MFFLFFRVFVVMWNVGGRILNNDFNFEDFLFVEGILDIYICGYELKFDKFWIYRFLKLLKNELLLYGLYFRF